MPDRVLVCHTDARAAKVEEISNVVKVSWLFYHPKRKVQLVGFARTGKPKGPIRMG
jgi:hypothetical protein